MKTPIQNLIVFTGICLIAFLLYGNTLTGSFQFDDELIIENGQMVKSLHSFADASVWFDVNNRTFSRFTLALNYKFGGLNTMGFHVINVLIHALATFLIFLLTKLIISKFTNYKNQLFIAITCTLIFLVHPLQTQSVSYIVQRMSALAGLFYISSIFFYLKARTQISADNRRIILLMALALLSGYLAIMSKQSAATIPLVLVLCEITFLRKSNKKNSNHYLAILAGIFLGMLVILLLNPSVLKSDTNEISRADYMATELRVLVKYIQLLILPVSQNIDHDFSISRTLWNGQVISSLVFHGILLYLAIRNLKRKPLLSFIILWFYITLSVESSIIPIRDVIVEHRLYLPVFSIAFGLSLLIAQNFKKKIVAYSSVAVLVLLLSTATYSRNKVWANPILLWQDASVKSPKKARVFNNLARAYQKDGNTDLAFLNYKKAVAIDPNYSDALNNLGLCFYSQNNFLEAENYFRLALSSNPNYPLALNNLGLCFHQKAEYGKAIKNYNSAIKANPSFAEAYFNKGNSVLAQGDADEAIRLYDKAIQLRPMFFKAFYNKANALYKTGSFDRAIKNYNQTLLLNPEFADAETNAGNAYLMMQDTVNALKRYKNALLIDPQHKEALHNISAIVD